jgi:hypothetical protein
MLFTLWKVRTEKYFPEVSEAARDRWFRDRSETEGNMFQVCFEGNLEKFQSASLYDCSYQHILYMHGLTDEYTSYRAADQPRN